LIHFSRQRPSPPFTPPLTPLCLGATYPASGSLRPEPKAATSSSVALSVISLICDFIFRSPVWGFGSLA
jgi:hypothetical protein